MIAFLRGRISSLSKNSIIIDVSGVGYNCIVSGNTLDFFSNKIKQEVVILIYHHINESTQSLFGFHDEDERGVFKLLIGVSGVGPKTAIQFLSSTSAKELKNKIKSGEVEALTSIPGIGAKTAKRIIIELKEKITSKSDNEIPIENNLEIESNYKDALDALLVLGYAKKDIINYINKIINKNKSIDTSDLIKRVLNKIGK